MAFVIAGCKSKTIEQLYTEGVQLLQGGNPGGAIVLLKNALDKDQNHAEARFQLAKAYAAAGKSEQAEKEYPESAQAKPCPGRNKAGIGKNPLFVNETRNGDTGSQRISEVSSGIT